MAKLTKSISATSATYTQVTGVESGKTYQIQASGAENRWLYLIESDSTPSATDESGFRLSCSFCSSNSMIYKPNDGYSLYVRVNEGSAALIIQEVLS